MCQDTSCTLSRVKTKYLQVQRTFDVFTKMSDCVSRMCQRSKRRGRQRYVHFIIESAQYLYMDIHQMDGFFNWTMTYR